MKDAGVPAGAGLAVVVAVLAGYAAWSWPLAAHLSTHVLVRDTAGAGAPEAGQPIWNFSRR